MARRDELIKSVANYSLRKKHQDYSDGSIYEHDHLTIIPDDGMYDEDRVMFSDSNFKFRTDISTNRKKRHFRGVWETTDGENEYWTLKDCDSATTSEEYKIVLKPKYSSLKDFAYFGSATELIKATVNDVVLNFPGGLAFYGEIAPVMNVDGENYYVVSNESNIDILTDATDETSLDNPMKVLSCTYKNYTDADGNSFAKPTVNYWDCRAMGHIIADVTVAGKTLYVYLGEGNKKYVLTKEHTPKWATIIKPKQEYIDKFFDNLDDFERVLLNRDTNPVYTATLDTPYETENGYKYRKEKYVWPTIGDGVTPDVTTGIFGGYLERLLQLADYYDTYESDNIWRMLTHESIKNLDWTFARTADGLAEGSDEEFLTLDSSKIKAILEMEGRQYDDIRRFAINIKNTNGITYNEEGNMPDYFLSDSVENKGWVAQYTGPSTDSATTEPLYSGLSRGYDSSKANINFLRRLSINSDFIQSLKGTKKGVKTILGMFGMHEVGYDPERPEKGDYTITESFAIVQNFPSYSEVCSLYCYSDDFYDESTNLLYGLPVMPITPSYDEGNESEAVLKKYIVPWFDKSMSYDDGKMYFQMKGGWKRVNSEKIKLSITSLSEITPVGETDLYGDTVPYIKYAETIDEMLQFSTNEVEEGTICYVSDITDMIGEQDSGGSYYSKYGYIGKNGIVTESSAVSNFSHYFILRNANLLHHLGYVKDDIYSCWGWENISQTEYNGESALTEDGVKILHIESMSQRVDGNNPHVGYGKYDEGEGFLEYYTKLFKHELDNNKFSTVKEGADEEKEEKVEEEKQIYTKIWSGVNVCGFSCSPITTNVKCFTFIDSTEDNCVPIGEQDDDCNRNSWGYPEFKNPEKGNTLATVDKTEYGEPASYSAINLKRMTINFAHDEEKFEDYVNSVVMKYLDEMIPSTTIWECTFGLNKSSVRPIVSRVNSNGKTRRIVADMAITDGKDNKYYMSEETINA